MKLRWDMALYLLIAAVQVSRRAVVLVLHCILCVYIHIYFDCKALSCVVTLSVAM
jgi:hypothetical protein